MINLMIVDDHTIMREGLKRLFELDKDIHIADEAANGPQALERLRAKHVDLLLLDISMPGLSGEALISRVVHQHPQLPILVLSMHNDPHVAMRVLRAGATGYMTKTQSPETLIAAVKKVSTGARYIDPELLEQIALNSLKQNPVSGLDSLTNREFQIMRLLADGLSVNQIAEQLMISNKTVSTHKINLMEKMGFSSNADLIKFASRLSTSESC
ncbi:response regulator transcription factor [Ectopseudomonas composti]|jgi:DNA-binding NarL/FixJ family response regulator|uniref:DNA-binding response regulator, NarL/FixJ family, contains REC and HTH domains n=1 Tax=Ectopseudomonas composti TaxID=658457 RepID=A0A1I5NKS4_9GAMM|nr:MULTISPECIES: response regulator transcription factor [Pseudomonas]MDN5514321.1 response regulator transcription factor [Pseudomonas sp.]QNH07152.1 response regulator transcription factor [Pseudomonas sp. B11D7D]SFP22384.1 DNA-binding response regulator, NarL/FixJ family, contains REC and HTH domains [Pseudomonas composti]